MYRVTEVDCADSIDKPLSSCIAFIIDEKSNKAYAVELVMDYGRSEAKIDIYEADEDVASGFTVARFSVFDDALRYAVTMLIEDVLEENIRRLWKDVRVASR